MKKVMIFLGVILLSLITTKCKKFQDNSLERGVGTVPLVSDVNPAVFDSKNLANTYVRFVLNVDPTTKVTGASIVASTSDTLNRVEVTTISSFPDTVTITAKEVADKLGINLDSIHNGDVFRLEVITTVNGKTTRSNAALDVAVACAFDKNLAIGSYNAYSAPSQWNTQGGITLTADPNDPYTIYVKGLATIDGVNEDKGPLVMHIDPITYAVTVDKTIIATSAFGYTNEAFSGSGTYSSCDGSYQMDFEITVDEGSFGSYLYTFTRN